LPGRKRARFDSINVMRARHPAWFREYLERLFRLGFKNEGFIDWGRRP